MLIKFISLNANRELYHSKYYSALHHLSIGGNSRDVILAIQTHAASMLNSTQTRLQPISPTAHWSYDPLVRRPIGPTTHWSDDPLVLRPIGPTAHWSYGHF